MPGEIVNATAPDPLDPAEMAKMVRKLVAAELEILNAMPFLGDDGLDRLAKIALILQRIRPAQPGIIAEQPSDKELMRKARELE